MNNLDVLSDFAADLESQFEPPPEGAVTPKPEMTQDEKSAWVPELNPTQLDIYNNVTSRFILAHGERGSGKSIAMLHKLVKHCYEEFNAFGLIVVGIKRTAIAGGAWEKLSLDVLPQWERGIGLKYTESKLVASTKDDYLYILNKYGGWSKIMLVSMPVENFVRERVRGLEFSMCFVDEISVLASDIYFSAVVQQLGRRPHIKGLQQYLAATNPEGPSHWVYKRFFVKPRHKETGQWNPAYAVYHVPISENEKNLPDGYYDLVREALESDPIEYRRLVLGEWVDRPLGASIFHDYFDERRHVRGDIEKDLRIIPQVGHDIILGYDLGTANSAIVFLQNIATKDREVFLAFDEINLIDRYVPYTVLVPAIMRRIDFWNRHCKTVFNCIHISDSSAFNMFRATDGTYDSLEVERLSAIAHKDFPDVQPIKMIPAPKYNGSVGARVKTVMKYLSQDRLFISSSCDALKGMFLQLETEKMKDGKWQPNLAFEPKRSKHVHIWDALSYPIFTIDIGQTPVFKKEALNPPELMPLGTSKSY